MGDMKQTVSNLGNSIPGYIGYQSKERRRDADRILRERLTTQYNSQRDRLTRIQQDAVRSGQINVVSDIEGAQQQLGAINNDVSKLVIDGDYISANRKLLEDIQWRTRRLELEVETVETELTDFETELAEKV